MFWDDLDRLVQGFPQEGNIVIGENLNGLIDSETRPFIRVLGGFAFVDLNEEEQYFFFCFSMTQYELIYTILKFMVALCKWIRV